MANSVGVRRFMWLPRVVYLVAMVYLFLVAIELFSQAMVKAGGKEAADSLFSGLENPFAGLAVGVLATVLVQSSSVTTCTIVALVANGLKLEFAIPMVMGANIGTSITCVLVSLGHVTRDEPFRRAFAGATVHDMFNFLTVLILFPLEMATGFLQHGAEFLVGVLVRAAPAVGGAAGFKSPVKTAVQWAAKNIASLLEDGLGLQGKLLAGALFLLALVLIIVALIFITKNMKALMADRIEAWLNRVLRRRGILGLLIGTVITMAVQSSSITTSLLIPMFGAGVLSLEAGFPIMVGANIGTTITAMLTALVAGGPLGLTIAVVHLLFNLTGTMIFFPFRFMRRIPIRLAEMLADLAITNRVWVLVYILGVFVGLPLLGIFIW